MELHTMHFCTSDENFQKNFCTVVKFKFLKSIPLEFLKSFHSPQTRLKKNDYLLKFSQVTRQLESSTRKLRKQQMFPRQENEVRKNDNRIGGAAVSDRYPKPNYLQS